MSHYFILKYLLRVNLKIVFKNNYSLIQLNYCDVYKNPTFKFNM